MKPTKDRNKELAVAVRGRGPEYYAQDHETKGFAHFLPLPIPEFALWSMETGELLVRAKEKKEEPEDSIREERTR